MKIEFEFEIKFQFKFEIEFEFEFEFELEFEFEFEFEIKFEIKFEFEFFSFRFSMLSHCMNTVDSCMNLWTCYWNVSKSVLLSFPLGLATTSLVLRLCLSHKSTCWQAYDHADKLAGIYEKVTALKIKYRFDKRINVSKCVYSSPHPPPGPPQ